jgi:hypothetical protein
MARTIRGSNADRIETFLSSPKRPEWLWRPHSTMGTGVLSPKKSNRGVKLTSHLLLALRLGVSGAIHFIQYVFIVHTGTSLLLRGSSSLHRQTQLRSQEKWKVACNE